MKFTKCARTIAEIFDLSLGGQSGGHPLSCLNAPLTQTTNSAFCPLADINKKLPQQERARGGLPISLSISISPPRGARQFKKKFALFGFIAIFASEINNKSIMLAQVENTPLGYIVSVYFALDGLTFHWYRLRNFGDSQCDARFYMLYRVSSLSDFELRYMIKNYNPQRIYKI